MISLQRLTNKIDLVYNINKLEVTYLSYYINRTLFDLICILFSFRLLRTRH